MSQKSWDPERSFDGDDDGGGGGGVGGQQSFAQKSRLMAEDSFDPGCHPPRSPFFFFLSPPLLGLSWASFPDCSLSVNRFR